jgi:co-chaperonin GroES (HSP10)
METSTEKQTNEILDLMLIYKPLRDDVVLKLPTKEERELLAKSKTGIIKTIDLKKTDNDYLYTIVAVGKDCKEVKPGDKVIFKASATIPVIVIKGVEYGQIGEMWVCGIVTE